MKIKLAMVDTDEKYLSKISSVFNKKYPNEIEIYTFSKRDAFIEIFKNQRMDVVLVNEEFLGDDLRRENTQVACLTESLDITEVSGFPAVCKYQRVDLICKEVKSLCAELDTKVSYSLSGSQSPIILFHGASGGLGTSTAAIGFALHMVEQGHKVFYLDLEKNGYTRDVLAQDSNTTLSEVLYAIKSNRANLSLKLEAYVSNDKGVAYYAPFKTIMDFNEMKSEDVKTLLHVICNSGNYDRVIVDTDVCSDEIRDTLFELADCVVMVADGTEIGRNKLQNKLFELQNISDNKVEHLMRKTKVLYSKFGSQSNAAEMNDVQVVGYINKVKGDHRAQVVSWVSKLDVFDHIL